jgi:uncharacterized damage-inducible protein DinB
MKLTDGQLASEISLWGRTMAIAASFQGLVGHLIHHRGQMTVLMREAGLIVPGPMTRTSFEELLP